MTNFTEAIRLYDVAAFRYQDDPSALSAYVQIANSYCALGRFEEARTANERATFGLEWIQSDLDWNLRPVFAESIEIAACSH